MRIIDCDSHCIFPDIFDNIPNELSHLVPRLKFDAETRLIDVITDVDPLVVKAPAPATMHCDLPGMANVHDRIKNLNSMKVDLQLLSPQERAMRFDYSVEKNLAAAMAHSYNVSLKSVIDRYPNRFFGAALVPLQDIDLALTELDWIIDNNFTIVYVDYTYFDHSTTSAIARSTVPRMDEFYKKCEDNNIVLYTHFFMNSNIKFNAPENIKQMVKDDDLTIWEMGIYDLLLSDVFDRFPKLQVVFAEVTQQRIGKILRTLHTTYTDHRELLKCKHHPEFYFKNNIFITIDIEMKESFNLLMKNIGSDRLLFSTDYPHVDIGGQNKWKDVDDLYAAGLSTEDLENIAFRNAEKLFRLKP